MPPTLSLTRPQRQRRIDPAAPAAQLHAQRIRHPDAILSDGHAGFGRGTPTFTAVTVETRQNNQRAAAAVQNHQLPIAAKWRRKHHLAGAGGPDGGGGPGSVGNALGGSPPRRHRRIGEPLTSTTGQVQAVRCMQRTAIATSSTGRCGADRASTSSLPRRFAQGRRLLFKRRGPPGVCRSLFFGRVPGRIGQRGLPGQFRNCLGLCRFRRLRAGAAATRRLTRRRELLPVRPRPERLRFFREVPWITRASRSIPRQPAVGQRQGDHASRVSAGCSAPAAPGSGNSGLRGFVPAVSQPAPLRLLRKCSHPAP